MIWNENHRKYLLNRCSKISRMVLLNRFNKKFDLDISISQLNIFLAKSTKPRNDEVVKDGIIYRKFNNGKLKAAHHIVYEDYHKCSLKKNELVIFVDGNKNNFDIKNLIKITRRQMGCIVGRKLTGRLDDIQISEKLIAIIDMHEKLK